MHAGDLRERVAFDAPVPADDGNGGVDTTFGAPEDAYVCWAHFRFLRGGEIAQGARMEGRQLAVVTIRVNPKSLVIDEHHRMRDLKTGRVAAVRSPAALTDDRAMLEFTVEFGAPE